MRLHLKGKLYSSTVYFIYFFAAVFLLYLVSSVQPDVFFSGDGGVKFMVVKQLNAGEGYKNLYMPQPEWVKQIWNQGFFPIKKPFVYLSPEGNIISFPPAFQIISSFFYKKFGYIGLYIIPFASTLLLWGWFIFLIRKINVHPKITAASFFLLAFCSPLTFYGAAYWEHIPSVLLLFSGVVFILSPQKNKWLCFAYGCMCGFAVWLRPEALLINVFYIMAVLIANRKKLLSYHLLFIAGSLIGALSFLLFNKIMYGAFFGAHGFQLLDDETMFAKLKMALGNLFYLNLFMLQYFPISLLLLFVLYGWLKLKWPLSNQSKSMLLIAVAFCALSPFLLPNRGGKQWGPRYFLPVMPIVIILLALIWQEWRSIELIQKNKKILAVVGAAIIAYSFFLNTFKEASVVRDDNHNRILPAMNFIKQQPENEIVVNSDFVTMEFGAIFKERNFFLAEDCDSMKKLITMLKQRGVHSFIYINYWDFPEGFAALMQTYHATFMNKGMYSLAKFQLND